MSGHTTAFISHEAIAALHPDEFARFQRRAVAATTVANLALAELHDTLGTDVIDDQMRDAAWRAAFGFSVEWEDGRMTVISPKWLVRAAQWRRSNPRRDAPSLGAGFSQDVDALVVGPDMFANESQRWRAKDEGIGQVFALAYEGRVAKGTMFGDRDFSDYTEAGVRSS